MAGIDSFILENFNLEDSEEAMEADDDEELEDNSAGREEEGGGRDKLRMLYRVAKSPSYERPQLPYMVLRMCRNAVTDGTKLNFDDIMQSVQLIIDDPEVQVRVELVKLLPKIVMVCLEAPQLFGDVLNEHFLAIILKYLQDTDNQVRLAAQTALLGLLELGLLDSATIKGRVYPVVNSLLSMSADHLNLGLTFMGKIAPLIDEEQIVNDLRDKFVKLCEKEEFFIRKVCATQFPVLCSVVGKEDFELRLFPYFLDLCADDTWAVRKACVDAVMAVSCCLALRYRSWVLADAFAILLVDDTKWVRMSAYQILGPFISTFAKQFAKVTYSPEGELVFTTKAEKHVRLPNGEKTIGSLSASTRYCYEGIFPTKCTIRSEKIEAGETATQKPIENLNSTVTLENSVAVEESAPQEEQEDEAEEEEGNHVNVYILSNLISKVRMNERGNKEVVRTDDSENYNPFLYYYIPPDLPLDDDLVEAAKITAAENTDESKSGNSTPTFEIASSSSDEGVGIGLPPLHEDRSNFKGEAIVPKHLIDSFLSMAEAEHVDMVTDVPHYCAFSFPAVTLTVGRENWPYLKNAYEALANASQWKVRGTLASSIHEMALILGNEITVSDLLPIYDGFIQDLDEVRISVVKHLATFLKLLKPANRSGYLPRLKWFLRVNDDKTTFNWRLQEELAIQLIEIVHLFEPSDVRRHIVPLAFDLVRNKIAAVRHAALTLMTQIVAHLSVSEFLVMNLFRRLRRHFTATTGPWIRRQMFALLCAQLIANNAISGDRFSQEMLPSLLKLSWDKVPNVRLAVARTLSRHVIAMGPEWLGSAQTEEVDTRLKQMRLDPDRDVRVLAGGDESTVTEAIGQNKQEQSQNIVF